MLPMLNCAFMLIFGLVLALSGAASAQQSAVLDIMQTRAREADIAYGKSRFSSLSKDYLSRFHRDPFARVRTGEIEIEKCIIALPEHSSKVVLNLATLLQDFLTNTMNVRVQIDSLPVDSLSTMAYTIELGEIDNATQRPTTFTIDIARDRASIRGNSEGALRDGVVRLIDQIGFRSAPILKIGTETIQTTLDLRLGAIPWLGSMRDVVLMGYNAVIIKPYLDLHEISTSQALPELAYLHNPESLVRLARAAQEARQWGLRPYIHLNNRQRFPDNHPVFMAHPDAMGPRVWNGYGGHILSTNSPSVRRYIFETVKGLFTAVPDLSGILVIVGGEGFYHCYMHPQGFSRGQTDTELCGNKGAEETVASLVNTLSAAARSVNPTADVIAWPYSAQFTWSRDRDQAAFMALLDHTVSVATEVENGEVTRDRDGIVKSYWDYSIGIIGPSKRAMQQIELAKQDNLRIYLHTEPELSLDFGGLPFIPSPSRWLQRAAAVVTSGANGILAMPYFNEFYASEESGIQKYAWFSGNNLQDIEQRVAGRIAGIEGGAHLQRGWDLISEAISLSPQIPPYFTGPTYLGPAHPLMLDPREDIPPVFYGKLLYLVESSEPEALEARVIVDRIPQVHSITEVRPDGSIETENPPGNSIGSFAKRYELMLALVDEAVREFEQASAPTSGSENIVLASELSVARWFQQTLRTTADFYEGYELRNCATGSPSIDFSQDDRAVCYQKLAELVDTEDRNTRDALRTLANDPRLDVYFQPFVAFSHSRAMIEEKLRMLDYERRVYLPSLARAIENSDTNR